MTDETDRQELWARLSKLLPFAPINKLYQPHNLQVGRGTASLEMPVLPQFFNGGMTVHGSVFFKGLDETAWFAANSLASEFAFATTSFSTYLLRLVRKGNLQVKAHVVSATKNLVVVDAEMFNDGDAVVAKGTGTFQPTSIPITTLLVPPPADPRPPG